MAQQLNAQAHHPLRGPGPAVDTRRARRAIGLIVLTVCLLMLIVVSLAVGAKPIPPSVVVDALTQYDDHNTDHLVVVGLRIPRTLIGLCVGLALGVAGALMQAVTRNPLADPGLLGVNAGAACAVVIGLSVYTAMPFSQIVWLSFAGAGVGAVVVYMLGNVGSGGVTAIRLTLAGVALSAMLGAITGAITLFNEDALDRFRFWAIGSVAGRSTDIASDVIGFLVAGVALAYVIARPMNAFALGEASARSLGIHVGRTRLVALLAITLLCGSAVAAAGPIGFVGLVVPHAARIIFGADYRWLLPGAAVIGPLLLLGCDVAGRVIGRPGEVQVGIMTAAIGGPLFVWLARSAKVGHR